MSTNGSDRDSRLAKLRGLTVADLGDLILSKRKSQEEKPAGQAKDPPPPPPHVIHLKAWIRH